MVFNIFLFLAEFLSEYFSIGAFAFTLKDQVRFAALAFVFIAIVLALQTAIVRWITKEREFPKILRALLWAHLPWVFGLFWPLVQKLNLPDPRTPWCGRWKSS